MSSPSKGLLDCADTDRRLPESDPFKISPYSSMHGATSIARAFRDTQGGACAVTELPNVKHPRPQEECRSVGYDTARCTSSLRCANPGPLSVDNRKGASS